MPEIRDISVNTVKQFVRVVQKKYEINVEMKGSVGGGTNVNFGLQGQIPFMNNTDDNFDYNNLLVWDNVSNRLGLGTDTPSATLDIVPSDISEVITKVTSTGSHTGDLLQYFRDTTEIFSVDSEGFITSFAGGQYVDIGRAFVGFNMFRQSNTGLYDRHNPSAVGFGWFGNYNNSRLSLVGQPVGTTPPSSSVVTPVDFFVTNGGVSSFNNLVYINSGVDFSASTKIISSATSRSTLVLQKLTSQGANMLEIRDNVGATNIVVDDQFNVGIGLDNPLDLLHLRGGALNLNSLGSGIIDQFFSIGGGVDYRGYTGATVGGNSNENRMMFSQGLRYTGSVTTPTYTRGQAVISRRGLEFNGTSGAGFARFIYTDIDTTDPLELFTIKDTGFVGVNQDTPLAYFHIKDDQDFESTTNAFLIEFSNTPSAQNSGYNFLVRSDASVKLSNRYPDVTNSGLHVNYFGRNAAVFVGRSFSGLQSTGMAVSNHSTGQFDFSGSVFSAATFGGRMNNAATTASVCAITRYATENYLAAPATVYGTYSVSTTESGLLVNGNTKTFIGVYGQGSPSYATDNSGTTSIGLYGTANGAQNNYAAIFDQGNVGVGTLSPTHKFHVLGASLFQGSIDELQLNVRANASQTADVFRVENSVLFPHLLVDSAGRVRVNNAPGTWVGGNAELLVNGIIARGNEQYISGNQIIFNGAGEFVVRNNGSATIRGSSSTNQLYVGSGSGVSPENYIALTTATIERMRVDPNGNMGLGTTTPSSRIDIDGTNGYDQLRLRDSYTPSSSADPVGNTGNIRRDDNYIYVKTSTGDVKRSPLSLF